MIEVELKFRLNEGYRALIQKKMDREFGVASSSRQVDKIFLLHSDSFKTFKRGEPVMRIRAVDRDVTLAYKRTVNADGDRVEHELKVGSADVAEQMLQEMGYKLVTHVDKVRRHYPIENKTVTIDDVKTLGPFLEIEMLCDSETEVPNAQKEIMQIASDLNLSSENLEKRKYDEMISEANQLA